jgi:type II secretory pathway pseudopilin PulG
MIDPVTGMAAASLGANLVGGLVGRSGARRQARAAEEAARLQYQAAQDAIGEQRRQYDTTRADFAPYAGAGQRGIDTYEQELRGGQYDPGQFDFQARTRNYDLGGDPVFQNALDQAMKRIQTSAAARGSLGGGGTQRALQREAVNLGGEFENRDYNRFQGEEATRYGRASDAFNRDYGAKQDRANRFQGLGQMGMSAAGQLGQFGANSASQIGNLGMQGAQSLGQGLTQGAGFRAAGDDQLFNSIGGGVMDAGQLMGYGSRGSGVMRNSVMGKALAQPTYRF